MPARHADLVPVLDGWSATDRGPWTIHAPPTSSLPDQGWKLHCSALAVDAPAVLQRVADFCRDRNWAFKHLVDPDAHERVDAKDADRSGSGKFVTVYPEHGSINADLLDRLADRLSGLRGPRILGDLQWRNSVLHIRWGAFRMLETWDGRPAVRRPDGALEPDRRGVSFTLPSWVEAPAWLETERARTRPDPLADFTVTGAYSFSNSGGVYRAENASLGQVVLKEGREHVAVLDGQDAAQRLEKERDALTRLADSGVTPRPHDLFRADGSAFLVLEQVPGVPFNRAVVSGCPLTRHRPSAAERARHAESVEQAMRNVDESVDAIHRLGVVHGDLSPRNVLLGPDGAVFLVDFESATTDTSDRAQNRLATPGFVAPPTMTGVARDRFALACLHLAALVPLTSLVPLDPYAAHRILAYAEQAYPTADLTSVRERLVDAVTPLSSDMPSGALPREVLRQALTRRSEGGQRGLHLTEHGSGGLENGVAGVHFVLGRGDDQARRARLEGTGVDDGLGLFSGRAGAFLVGGLDRDEWAGFSEALERTDRVDLFGGLAGIGVALLLAERNTGRDLSSVLNTVTRRLSALTIASDRLALLPPGLLHGPSGIALFLTLYGRRRHDPRSLDAARRAVGVDLGRLRPTRGAGLQLAVGPRVLPFLGSGSAGVGVALAQLHRTTNDASLVGPLTGILDATAPDLAVHAGLFEGRAGLVHAAVDIAELGIADRSLVLADFAAHREAFTLHHISVDGRPTFPDARLRGPDDGLGHGSAGVLSALDAMADFETGVVDPEVPSFLRRRTIR